MKLAHIPKKAPRAAVAAPVREDDHHVNEGATIIGDDDLHIYGLDPSSPDYAARLEKMKDLRREDPELFKRIQRLD